MPYLMGVDVSTTGVKNIIIDQNGSVVCAATTPQTLSTPEPLWSEQDPSDWWRGTVNSILYPALKTISHNLGDLSI